MEEEEGGSQVAGVEPTAALRSAETGVGGGEQHEEEEERGMPIEVLPNSFRTVYTMNPINHR